MSHSQEVQDLTASLDLHRALLLRTAHGLTDEQARRTSTVSELTIAALLKHVADTEEQWMDFAVRGPEAHTDDADPDAPDTRFALNNGDTLQSLEERLLQVGARTTELLNTLDLNTTHELPPAPWFEPGARWSVRGVALHLIGEISQHSGHADIIREAIDGAKTMG